MADLSFLKKEKLHTGFGNEIIAPKGYDDVLHQAGLDWTVQARPIFTNVDGTVIEIPNSKAIVRNEDSKTLGIVSSKYKIVDNSAAFNFTESLFKDGQIEFVRGGSYRGGSSTWLEAKVTTDYEILGDKTECYIIFKNSHDGTGSVIAMIVPTRVACSNALNVALKNAPRSWRCVHSGDPLTKIAEAREVLLAGSTYMDALNEEMININKIRLSEEQIIQFTNRLFPIPEDATDRVREKREERRNQLLQVFHEKDDLQDFGRTGYRFVSAVADYVNHADGDRNTVTATENRFMRVAHGDAMVDKAYSMVLSA